MSTFPFTKAAIGGPKKRSKDRGSPLAGMEGVLVGWSEGSCGPFTYTHGGSQLLLCMITAKPDSSGSRNRAKRMFATLGRCWSLQNHWQRATNGGKGELPNCRAATCCQDRDPKRTVYCMLFSLQLFNPPSGDAVYFSFFNI